MIKKCLKCKEEFNDGTRSEYCKKCRSERAREINKINSLQRYHEDADAWAALDKSTQLERMQKYMIDRLGDRKNG